MNLYEINHAIIQTLSDSIDEETGEVIDDLDIEKLDELNLAREVKILNIAKLIKNLTAEQAAINHEKSKFQQWESSIKNRVESLKNYLINNLREGEKFKDTQIMVSYKKPLQKVQISDVDVLPDEFKKISVLADKAKIKRQLLDGEIVLGAKLELGEPSVLIK
ncbi:siphovirus Gp157 family protein [Thiotrichales bacterium 19X7-9]|nr:siphovirus Gp157 family protein [Thiotrichales bacterium 19X7-9]